MFFKKKSNIMFRNYKSFGYITDNRNFGYNHESNVGDKILSESGAIFVAVLGKKVQSFNSLVKKIHKQFTDIHIKTIEKDAREFYEMLEQDGFIVSGTTFQECEAKDIGFSYKLLESELISSNIISLKRSSQDFFEEYFKGEPQLTNLHIEITSRCNERCVHCYIPNDNKVNDIEPSLFYKILEQCNDMKLLHLTLSGGEPMLHPNFCDFLKKCREYDLSINILTNLTLLNDDIVLEMKRNPLLGVQVSLYSMNPDIHDEITQMKGSFEKTKNAILKLIENNIPMQISCPIMKQNKNNYNDVKEWAKKHNIHVGDDYTIIAKYDHTTQNLSNRLSINEAEELINNIINTDIKYVEKIEEEVERKKNSPYDDYVCSICNSSICITESGNVYPCAGWQDNIVGDVKETSLKNIWENSEKVKYLRGIKKRDFPKCIQCLEKEYCTMCMVRNANEDPMGDPLVVNEYFCEIAKLNKKIITNWKEKFDF